MRSVLKGSRGAAWSGALMVAALAVGAAGCTGAPLPAPSSVPTAMSAVPSAYPTEVHTPVTGEHWQAGRALALPCQDGPSSAETLLRKGSMKAKVEHYVKPEIVLRAGGRIDLADGVLGVSGADYVSAEENASSPDETTYTTVPKGVGVVTIALFRDAADGAAASALDFAGAEVRLSATTPVRWEEHGFAGTDIATAAWFGKAARERFAATGYNPFTSLDDQGRMDADVTAVWDSPCYYFDVAPREIGAVHDVVLVVTNGDGGFTQYVGYDASGHPAAAVLLGYVPWSGLGLPGTPPPGVK